MEKWAIVILKQRSKTLKGIEILIWKQLSNLVIRIVRFIPLLNSDISCPKLYIHFPHGIYPCFVGRSKEAKKKRKKEIQHSPKKKKPCNKKLLPVDSIVEL